MQPIRGGGVADAFKAGPGAQRTAANDDIGGDRLEFVRDRAPDHLATPERIELRLARPVLCDAWLPEETNIAGTTGARGGRQVIAKSFCDPAFIVSNHALVVHEPDAVIDAT